jgi:hypothetical protein
MNTQDRHISSKLIKAKALSGRKDLVSHLPRTRKMNKDVLLAMLGQYGMVYIKPYCGSLGQGVIRVERLTTRGGGAEFRYQAGVKVHKFTAYEAAYQAILKETGGKSYLVQKGIRLLRYEGRPFDIRVMVQRNLKGQWEASGIAGRVAHPQKVVTNGSQGGTIFPVELLLRGYTDEGRRRVLIKSLESLGVRAAKQLNAVFPHIQEFGVDIALDRNLKPWILEVNTRPDPCPFTKLKDRTMINRIVRYGKAHGCTYSLKCNKSKQGVV